MLGVLQRDDARAGALRRRVAAVDGHLPLQEKRRFRRGPAGQRGPADQTAALEAGRPVVRLVEQLLEPLAGVAAVRARHAGQAVSRAARARLKSAASRAAARHAARALCPAGSGFARRFASLSWRHGNLLLSFVYLWSFRSVNDRSSRSGELSFATYNTYRTARYALMS